MARDYRVYVHFEALEVKIIDIHPCSTKR